MKINGHISKTVIDIANWIAPSQNKLKVTSYTVKCVIKSNLQDFLQDQISATVNIASGSLHLGHGVFVVNNDSMNFAARTVTNLYPSTPGDAHIQGLFDSQLPHSSLLSERSEGLKLKSETVKFHSEQRSIKEL